jgi:hypothetical protein
LVADHWLSTAILFVLLAIIPPVVTSALRERLYQWELRLMARYPRDAIATAASEPEAEAFEGMPLPTA